MCKKYTFEEFVEIIEALRGEGGCPWDREQTHESLRPCMMEEAAELLGAIRIYKQTGNPENMEEELGDILLQTVMHSVIAREEELFTIEDVITGISEKMIRRHPHVFGNAQADTAGKVLQNWEEIKKQEKEGKDWMPTPLREIPAELASLTRAVKVTKKIDKLYGEDQIEDYAALSSNLVKEAEALQSIKDMSEKEKISDAVTNVLRTVCRLSYRAGIQPEQLLYDDIEKIIDQYEKK